MFRSLRRPSVPENRRLLAFTSCRRGVGPRPRDNYDENGSLNDYFRVYVNPALNWNEFFLLPNAGSFKKSSKAETLKPSRL
jgi:hypothetical protein